MFGLGAHLGPFVGREELLSNLLVLPMTRDMFRVRVR